MISERLEHTSVTINIHGVFDTEAAQEFSLTAQRAYRMGFRDFYVSLKAVTMIDKSGLTLLSNVMHQLQQRGCKGSIIHASSSLHTMLRTQQKNPALPRNRKQHTSHDSIPSLIA